MIVSRLTGIIRQAGIISARTITTSAKRSGGHGPASYRVNPEAERKFVIGAEICGGFMWWWIFWHCMTDYEHIIGHFEFPRPYKWSNEELGIPSDSIEDPE